MEVRRNNVVEAVHRVIGVAVHDGHTVASFGPIDHECYLRSCAKPIQALALRDAAPELDHELLAVACASHSGEAYHLAAVERLLHTAACDESQLVCGPPQGTQLSRRHNACSGKHAGMLLACCRLGWDVATYHRPSHPLQRKILSDIADLAGRPAHEILTGIDGCGLPCHSLRLREMALMFTRLDAAVCLAMSTHPLMVGGLDTDDTTLMQARPGWVAKYGAEGLLCAVSPEGIALVVKSLDGSPRPVRAAISALAVRAGLGPVPGFDDGAVTNTLGHIVGHVAAR